MKMLAIDCLDGFNLAKSLENKMSVYWEFSTSQCGFDFPIDGLSDVDSHLNVESWKSLVIQMFGPLFLLPVPQLFHFRLFSSRICKIPFRLLGFKSLVGRYGMGPFVCSYVFKYIWRDQIRRTPNYIYSIVLGFNLLVLFPIFCSTLAPCFWFPVLFEFAIWYVVLL